MIPEKAKLIRPFDALSETRLSRVRKQQESNVQQIALLLLLTQQNGLTYDSLIP